MSSFSMSVSGARPLTSTINAPEQTSATLTSKADDNFSVQVAATEIQIVLPANARIELRQKEGSDTVYAVLVAQGSLNVFGDSRPEGAVYPHVWLNAGKHVEYFTDTLGVVGTPVAAIGDLIPATE